VSSPRHRPALIIFVIIAALTCLGLGWWQWDRFREAGGTAQNLGYALQWPLFAGFFVYAYRRFVRLEREHRESDETAGSDMTDTPDVGQRAVARPLRPHPVTEIPSGLLPPRPAGTVKPAEDDDEMTEYNRYLAELNARDRKTG
jgi:DNA-binding transcriptional regulator of glucitol operon